MENTIPKYLTVPSLGNRLIGSLNGNNELIVLLSDDIVRMQESHVFWFLPTYNHPTLRFVESLCGKELEMRQDCFQLQCQLLVMRLVALFSLQDLRKCLHHHMEFSKVPTKLLIENQFLSSAISRFLVLWYFPETKPMLFRVTRLLLL